MKEYRVKISFEATYNADSKDEVKEMISDEYGLGDVECLDLYIDEVNK